MATAKKSQKSEEDQRQIWPWPSSRVPAQANWMIEMSELSVADIGERSSRPVVGAALEEAVPGDGRQHRSAGSAAYHQRVVPLMSLFEMRQRCSSASQTFLRFRYTLCACARAHDSEQ
jgi:hypothetical protein